MSYYRYHIFNDDNELIGYLYRSFDPKPGESNLFINAEDEQLPAYLDIDSSQRPLDALLIEPIEVKQFDEIQSPLTFQSLNHFLAELENTGAGSFKKVTDNTLVIKKPIVRHLKVVK